MDFSTVKACLSSTMSVPYCARDWEGVGVVKHFSVSLLSQTSPGVSHMAILGQSGPPMDQGILG